VVDIIERIYKVRDEQAIIQGNDHE
jgi:hypothetical protein